MSSRVVETRSEEETAGVGAGLASRLEPGSIVLLIGDLGAGKTAFVRGMAAGLGLDPDEVSSPTFTLVQEYRASQGAGRPGRLEGGGSTTSSRPGQGRKEGDEGQGRFTLYHVDLYRLEGGEVDDLGLEELVESGGVVAIEWAEKLRDTLPGATRVEIVDLGDDRRRIRIARPGTDRPPR